MDAFSFPVRIVTTALLTFAFCLTVAPAVARAQIPAVQTRVASIPLEIAGDNYILLKARVNDSEPMTFELDSGGGSGLVLYHRAAELLKVKSAGKGKGGGAGEATFETSLIKGASLSIGGVTMKNQTFVVFPPDNPRANLGQTVDGIIGFSLFNRYVVEIDYRTKVVNLYEPSTYQYVGRGESIPIEILSRVPFARVQVPLAGRKPIGGRFLVDLGAGRFTLILNTPVVSSNNLLSITPGLIKEPGAVGVGGEVKLFAGRWTAIQLGSFTLTEPVIHFAQDRKGAFASSDFNGLIGGELLRRFTVIFDYAHKRMILEPNAGFRDRFDYDMSGIRLRFEGTDFKELRVSALVENSPAVEAGIREGDRISAIDGKLASQITLPEISKLFRQEGKELVLDIIRGDEKKQIKLKLRRLV